MNFKNKTLLVGIATVIAVMIIFIAWKYSTPSSFRCPNDYATVEEYVTGVTDWASGALLNSPNMTKGELLSERQKLFKEHNCEPSRWPTLPGGF